jgi:hypothetical protein
MSGTRLTDTSVMRARTLVGAVLTLSMLAAAAANADTLNPSDTVTDPGGTVTVSGSGAATTITPTVSYSVGNEFNGSSLTDFPGLSGPWNFYDDYVFTVAAGANIEGAVVSFSNGVVGVSDLQARIFSTTTPYTAAVAASNLGAPSSGSVVDNPATMNSGDLYTVDLMQTLLAPGTYDLQIRGEVASSGSGSYGGDISFTAVPLPPGLVLLLSGLGLFGAAAARHRVQRV